MLNNYLEIEFLSLMAQIVGFIAAFFSSVSFLPQTYRIIKTNNIDSLSLFTLVLCFSAASFWIIYGILRHDIAILITNVIALIIYISIFILYYKIHNAKSKKFHASNKTKYRNKFHKKNKIHYTKQHVSGSN